MPLLRSSLFALLLTLLAVASIAGLSTWHAADPHEDRPAMSDMRSGLTPTTDGDTMVHVAAHAIGHGIDMPSAAIAPAVVTVARQAWQVVATVLPTAPAPASLLRPPRA